MVWVADGADEAAAEGEPLSDPQAEPAMTSSERTAHEDLGRTNIGAPILSGERLGDAPRARAPIRLDRDMDYVMGVVGAAHRRSICAAQLSR